MCKGSYREATEGLFFTKNYAFLTLLPSFSCENDASLFTREALDEFALFILLIAISKAYFVSNLSTSFEVLFHFCVVLP